MDCPLIDFSSPERKTDSTPLIPNSVSGSCGLNHLLPLSISVEENNPFDLVDCQVAANTASENDPFEIVSNDAMKCKDSKVDGLVSKEESCIQVSAESLTESNCFTADCSFLNLDDIPPPEMFTSFDESCLFDDTSHAHQHPSPKECHTATVKSKEELMLSAQRMIAEIISRAESDATSDKQVFPQSRKSFDIPFNSKIEEVNLNFLGELDRMDVCEEAQCLFKKLSFKSDSDNSGSLLQKINHLQEVAEDNVRSHQKSRGGAVKLTSSEFDDWSRSEINNLNLSLGDFSTFGAFPESDSNQLNLRHDDAIPSTKLASISLEDISSHVLPLATPVYKQCQKGDRRRSRSSGPDSPKQLGAVSSSASPILMTLPLCEDAVKNLNLCSKFSPRLNSSVEKNHLYTVDKKNSVSSTAQVKKGAEPKLFLRKPITHAKPPSRMAPMKATAPVQNMTRVKTSPGCSNRKLPVSNLLAQQTLSSKDEFKKSTPTSSACGLKISQSPRTANVNGTLKIQQSPRLSHVNGPLKNLPSKTNRLPTRLPSPQRPSGNLGESTYLKKKSDCDKSGGNARVLTDINTNPVAWRSPKRRLHHLDPVRKSRSILTEKENLLQDLLTQRQ